MSRRRGRWFILAVLALVTAALVWKRVVGPATRQAGSPRVAVDRLLPDSVRVKVEVLNATTVRGLARRATFHLRDLGFDVVSSGNSDERHDTTVVVVRSGRMDWGELAAKGLAPARVEARPDTSRYLDLSILLGTSWRPPPETFHP
jgi:hypothetical protein